MFTRPIEANLLKWGRQYKVAFSIRTLGVRRTIFLTDYEYIKKVFVQHADNFSNRPDDLWLIKQVTKEKGKILLGNRIILAVSPQTIAKKPMKFP